MVTRIASKMEGRKKDKHQQQHQQHEDKDKCDNRLKCWLGKHGELVDFSDVAPSPCKDFYHVFVTPQEFIFRVWKIVPPIRADSNQPPLEIRNSCDDFLHDERCRSEIQRLAGDGMLKYLERLALGQVDYLTRMPEDILVRIVEYLELEDIARLATVSKQFKCLCNSDKLWKKIYGTHCDHISQELEDLADREGWRRLFFTNKLQLQMQLRRQKRQHADQAFVTEQMDEFELQ